MPFREGVKQQYKQAKSDLKAIFKRKDGPDKSTTRPSTPSGVLPHTNAPAVVRQVESPGASVSGTPLLAQNLTNPPVVSPPGDAAHGNNHVEQLSQPINSTEQHHPGITHPSPSAPEFTSQAVGKNTGAPAEQSTSQPQALECGSADIPSSHSESNISGSIERSVSERQPQDRLGEASTGKGLKIFATGILQSAVDAAKFGPLQDISDALQSFAEMYIMEETVKKEYEALQQRLQALLKTLDEHADMDTLPTMRSKVQEAREFIGRELDSIRNKSSGEQHGRFLMAKEKEDRFLDCCRRIQEYMEHLLLDTSLSTSASINKIEEEQSKNHLLTSLWIARVEEEQSKNHLSTSASISKIEEQSKVRMSSSVSRLPSSPAAWYNSGAGAELKRRECTPGTRVDVLANLLTWAVNNSMDAVYWLNGMAGTGKTTIAYSICKELADKHKLAASFFCSRLRQECRDVKMIIPSIAYQLAQSFPPFQSALSAVIENDQDAHHKRLDEQFEVLIRKPLLAALAAETIVPGRVVVVIDALDECENKDSTRDILRVLLSKSVGLPIKFIVSSRPEPQIRDQMSNERVKSRLVLYELDTGDVQTDIKTYLQEELKPMDPQPTEAQISALVERAGILFIYAATAVRYIGSDNFGRNPTSRLDTILKGPQGQNTKKAKEIDQLYTTILDAAFGDEELEKAERIDMQQMLYTVICAREPLTVTGLSALLQINDNRIRAALRPMWSMLHVVETSELVTTLHASFPDFMFNSIRSKTFHCDSNAHNLKLAGHCFDHIAQTVPQFNLCGLESSYLPDDEVPNIKERVSKAISLELLYACRYWADHVEAGKCASSVADQLQEFLSTRLLLWMEVLNLNKQMKAGTDCMELMVKWCDQFEENQGLAELAHDAKRFVEAFASNPVSQSTPHIYVSMLTPWPRSAPIAKHYAQHTHGPVQAEGTALGRRQLAHLATWTFEKGIKAMAISPDGLYVALAIRNDTLIVDSSSGRVVLGPLTGHEETVESIAFSPDGTHVFAGSTHESPYYATILSWDTRTGDKASNPLKLKGHTNSIECLNFSPDCTCIITGARDKTVRLWDAADGKMLHRLVIQGSFWDAVFSPNGTRIAAGFERTLQVWDSQTGDVTLDPVTTSERTQRVVLSPDQSRIVCAGGYDTYKSIYVWDAQSGEKVLGPIEGHTDGITCIRCSPDGRYIVTGSYDRTIRLWDAQNGNLVLGPLEAHTDWITSVAFSPDGSRIISACEGGLVCTWDARQRNLTSSSANAPFDRITCVKFSSDGACFVSGSKVGTICIWNAHTGEMAVGLIKLHANQINAVDFLNDRVVSGSEDGKICVCDARTGEAVLGPLSVYSGKIHSIAFSPNGKLIATGSNGQVDVWDARTGSRVIGPLTGLDWQVVSLRFSPDGTRIVGGSWGRNVTVWDVSDGKNVFGTLGGHEDYVRSVSYSPNGALIASGSDDKTIIIWDAYTGKKALGPLTGHSRGVCSVDFSPDSTRLVSGSFDRTIRIWDVQTGEMMFELLNGHRKYITPVEYSPDGTRILSRSDDMSVRIHDARSPEERAQARSESEVGDWTINEDGWVVDDQGRLLVWVPGDLRRSLIWPSTLQVRIVPYGEVRLRFDKSRMGESWEKGFTTDL